MVRQDAPLVAEAFFLHSDGRREQLRVTVLAERWRSAASPDANGGRVGRITAVVLQSVACPSGFPLNVEHVFDYYSDDDDDWVEVLALDAWTMLNDWSIFAGKA